MLKLQASTNSPQEFGGHSEISGHWFAELGGGRGDPPRLSLNGRMAVSDVFGKVVLWRDEGGKLREGLEDWSMASSTLKS